MGRKIALFPLLLVFLITAGIGCKGASRAEKEAVRPISLEWWRVFDDADSMGEIIGNYGKIHPNISISYRKLRPEEYERELLNALAEDRGPDIFSIHNTWVKSYQPKLLPLPRELTIGYLFEKGGLQKETVIEVRKERSLRIDQLKNQFLDVVAEDVVLPHRAEDGTVSDKIFALPLAVDTLLLYANRDLLNSAGIPQPARSWEEFLEHAKKLTRLDAQGRIIQSGAAIGTADNIERASDILSVLMMQNGAMMIDNGGVRFHTMPPGLERPEPPGIQALRFYTDFANPAKEAYAWNQAMPNSFEVFTSGGTAYFFGYAYHLPRIKARAPKLNLAVSPLPQIDQANPINFANYWVEAVSAKTDNPDEAWDFLQFAAKEEQAKSYLERTGKPTALRSLIPGQIEDETLAPFAGQLLTAKSWYRGNDPAAAESAFLDMIRAVITGSMTPLEAAQISASRVQQTIR